MIYCWILWQRESEQYEKQRIEFNVEIKTLENERNYLDSDLKEINKEADLLARKYSIKNPLNVSDTGYVFVRMVRGEKMEVQISDSIASLLKKHNQKNKEISIKDDQLGVKKYELESLYDSLLETKDNLIPMIVVGFLLSIIGIFLWVDREDIEAQILKRQNLDKPTFSDHCQSCAKEFNSMVKYGTEKNNILNYHFCSNCFTMGEFINPHLTKTEMKEMIKNELVAKRKGKLYIKLTLKQIDKCERWI